MKKMIRLNVLDRQGDADAVAGDYAVGDDPAGGKELAQKLLSQFREDLQPKSRHRNRPIAQHA